MKANEKRRAKRASQSQGSTSRTVDKKTGYGIPKTSSNIPPPPRQVQMISQDREVKSRPRDTSEQTPSREEAPPQARMTKDGSMASGAHVARGSVGEATKAKQVSPPRPPGNWDCKNPNPDYATRQVQPQPARTSEPTDLGTSAVVEQVENLKKEIAELQADRERRQADEDRRRERRLKRKQENSHKEGGRHRRRSDHDLEHRDSGDQQDVETKAEAERKEKELEAAAKQAEEERAAEAAAQEA